MNLPLENKIAVVTGGAQGLGQAICGALAKAGCNVAIADMKDEAAQATAAEIVKATGPQSVRDENRRDAGSGRGKII